ncbi:MAG TPA: RDD family protein [Sphingomonas sp.]
MAKAVRLPVAQRRIRALVTPEGVPLPLELADAGERAGAFAIDLLVLAGAFVAMTLLLLLASLAIGRPAALSGAYVLWMLGAFCLRNLYFTAFEAGPRGATIGKRAMKLRVVARHGGRLTLDAVITRNAMREVEFYMPLAFLAARTAEGDGGAWLATAGLAWSAIFLFLPLFNRDRLRAGDLLAGTWVIRAPRRALLPDLADSGGAGVFTDAELDAYGIAELETLERVIRQGEADAIQTVAEAIRQRIGRPWTGAGQAADLDFLRAYYAALRGRLEAGLLFGRRRRDKHDSA